MTLCIVKEHQKLERLDGLVTRTQNNRQIRKTGEEV
jgi:hypothetical protein